MLPTTPPPHIVIVIGEPVKIGSTDQSPRTIATSFSHTSVLPTPEFCWTPIGTCTSVLPATNSYRPPGESNFPSAQCPTGCCRSDPERCPTARRRKRSPCQVSTRRLHVHHKMVARLNRKITDVDLFLHSIRHPARPIPEPLQSSLSENSPSNRPHDGR
jgi:hypothetical protein